MPGEGREGGGWVEGGGNLTLNYFEASYLLCISRHGLHAKRLC